MRVSLRGIAVVLLFFVSAKVMAERPQIKFGEVKPKDFEKTVYSIDSNANAIILSDIGSCKYEGSNNAGFNVVYKKHLRIRLLNKNGFDAANISIPLFIGTTVEEKLDRLEAITFNLENGKVVETKLEKNSIFKDKLSKHFNVRKFTMPNIKEGSIIDIQYTILSPYEQYLHSWQFQGEYPVLWSEFEATVPTVFDFVVISQGYHPFVVRDSKVSQDNYSILLPGSAGSRSELVSFQSPTVINVWAMENIPALKFESYTSTLENHLSKVDFQLSSLRYPGQPVVNIMNNWYTVSKELMKDPDFGEELTKSLNWLSDDVKEITAGASTPTESAKKIYQYVRDNFTCTGHGSKYKSTSLRKIMQNKSGNVADINILLTAMLQVKGFEAYPVLLSTRDNGKAYEVYPIMDKFNYVICKTIVDNKPYLLDASYNKLGFGKLHSDCYNGYARIISEAPVLINLSSDSLKENKITSLFLVNDEKGGIKGNLQTVFGHDESFSTREFIAKQGKEEFFKKLKKGYSQDIELSNFKIDSLSLLDEPMQVDYDFRLNFDEDIIYFDPMMSAALKANPFSSAKRYYPVEMPHVIDEIFVLRMDIPKGYEVDDAPKSTRVKYNEDEGMFEYLISVSNGVIQMRSKVQLKKATYLPEDYESLRDFFAFIVKKQNEQIVFKKIKQ